MQFVYSNPTKIVFGRGKINELHTLLPANARILFLYGQGSILKNGIYDSVIRQLQSNFHIEFGGITQNPEYASLMGALYTLRGNACNYILCAGGGSVVDAGKYVSAAACYNGDPWDLVSRKSHISGALPLGVVLTAPGTGSESNWGAVISRADTKEKLSFGSDLLRPQFAILDPNVMASLSKRQIIYGLVDSFVHVCEQYITEDTGHQIQERYAEALLVTAIALGKAIERYQQPEWQEDYMWLANQALNGLIGVGVGRDWATHHQGHLLTAQRGIVHAESLTMLHCNYLRSKKELLCNKLLQMGTNVFNIPHAIASADLTIDEIERFYINLNMPIHLEQYSIFQR